MLQVWLPMINSTENRGALNTTITKLGSGTYSAKSGKIGESCYHNTTNCGIVVEYPIELFRKNKLSICCWLRIDEDEDGNWHQIFIIGNYQIFNTYWRKNGDLRLNLNYGDNASHNAETSLVPFQTVFGTNLPGGEWRHIAMTFDGSYIKYYENGVLTNTFTQQHTLEVATKGEGSIKFGGGSTANSYAIKGCFNDIRIYDHTLSNKEVKEISKGLVSHYSLDNANAIGQDCSGYGYDGIVTGTISMGTGSPRYNKCAVFNGGTNYIAIGRGGFVYDTLTYSVWAYFDDWSEWCGGSKHLMRLISSTEGGGYNFDNSGSNGGIRAYVGVGTTSNGYISVLTTTTASTLNSTNDKWHMITVTYDGYTARIYIDGKLDGTSNTLATKTPLFYNSNNGNFLGYEAAGSTTVPAVGYLNLTGKMSDVRIYGTALSEEDILQLYKSPIQISDQYDVFCKSIDETISTNFRMYKNGIVAANSIVETDNSKTKMFSNKLTTNSIYEL